MPTRNVPAHFVRPNEANRYPRRIVTLDAESRIRETRTGETHSFMLACASFDELAKDGSGSVKTERGEFVSPGELWAWVDAHTRSRARTVVFAHNLAYDLRITDALAQLPRLGYLLDFLSADGTRCVARFTRHGPACGRRAALVAGAEGKCDCGDRRSLLLVDLFSFLPTSLEVIGEQLGLAKPALPKQNAPHGAWLERCAADVTITRAAVLRLLGWLESNDLGSFRLTGAAQAMACYRHRFMPRYGLMVHREEEQLARERRACWAGRCEAWRWGELQGPLHEWDFELAYLRLAATAYLPVRYRGEVAPPSVPQARALIGRRRHLLELDVEAGLPLLPAAVGERIAWPVGSFSTTVWDVEAIAAFERGARLTVRRAWAYDARPALASWAQWLGSLLAPEGLPVDSLERIMLKSWARSLIGRFGLRYPLWERVGTVAGSELQLVPFVDLDTGEEGAHLEAGGEWFERAGMIEAPDSMPAIMGAIMAAARVQLWRAAEIAGPASVAYMDTDSLIVDRAGNRELERWLGAANLGGLRPKATYRRALIRGPRSLELDDELRAVGVPKRSIRRSDGRFEAQLWEGLDRSLARGSSSTVRVTRRLVNPVGKDSRRVHLPGGATAPFDLTPLVDVA